MSAIATCRSELVATALGPVCPHHGCPGSRRIEPTDTYADGQCPDPTRCAHWKRHASGPWTCEFNHPRAGA